MYLFVVGGAVPNQPLSLSRQTPLILKLLGRITCRRRVHAADEPLRPAPPDNYLVVVAPEDDHKVAMLKIQFEKIEKEPPI